MKNIRFIIFGASVGAKHIFDILTNLGYNIIGFADNDPNKWNTRWEGNPIYNPHDLKKKKENFYIVIASVYYDEIKIQLLNMGIEKERIVLKEALIEWYIKNKDENFNKIPMKVEALCKNKIIFDLSEGFTLSGAVKWSLNVASVMKKSGCDIEIFSMKNENSNCNLMEWKENITWFDFAFNNYQDSIAEVVEKIESMLPCTVIINQIAQVFWASYIVKKKYGDKIKIISILHSDFSKIYDQNQLLDHSIDSYLCVSKEIRNHMTKEYGIASNKIYYKQSPVEYDNCYKKSYSSVLESLKIGYAARLEKAQKRADLLIPLIELLESQAMHYRLNIAGMGSYYPKLEQYVKEKQLEDKVILYKSISYDKMSDFWKKNDIFINLSDLEGSSISMLEAMSWGVIPIVTDTSGVKGIVENGRNGYINTLNNVKGIYENIKFLNEHRDKLKLFGNSCREKIKNNSNHLDYAKFILDIR